VYYNIHMIIFHRLKMCWQILTTGWCDCELWNLDHTISKNLLPRLKKFRKTTNGIPGGVTEKQWFRTLDKIIFAMDHMANDEWEYELIKAKNTRRLIATHKKIQEGCDLFGKYFQALWD